jgi:hypothetical protein
MKTFTLRPPRLRGEISESFFTTEYWARVKEELRVKPKQETDR